MLDFFKRISTEWKNLGLLNRLPASQRELVFYAESSADWPHFETMILELTLRHQRSLVYLTSDPRDPILTLEKLPAAARAKVLPLYIGSGTARTVLFKGLDCKVCVITLPDLETYHLKRSLHPVHYIYVFHSINSTQMIYRKGAFDAYDTILCVGPHHIAEIQKTEHAYNLKPKRLVEHGYARLDTIMERYASLRASYRPAEGPSRKVLLAPSWGACSFIEVPWGRQLIQALLEGGHSLVLRLHPMTVRRHPRLAASLEGEFSAARAENRFKVIVDMSEQESLAQADIMLSDWSGAAFEFAFGLERPVLFVNTPAKVNNPEWERIGLPPLEASIRTEIGDVLEMGELSTVANKIASLTGNHASFVQRLREARSRWIYNLGKSGSVGADEVVRALDSTSQPSTSPTLRTSN